MVITRQPTACRRCLPPVYPPRLRAKSGAVAERSLAHLHAKTEPEVSRQCLAASPGAGAKAALRALSRKEDRNTALPTFRDLPYVWMRDVLGTSDHLEGFGQSARIERRIVTGVGTGGRRAQAFVHDPLR